MLKEVEYKSVKSQSGDYTGKAEIVVDGTKLEGVISFDFSHSVSEIPSVKIELHPLFANLRQLADAELEISSDSVESAMECLRFYGNLDDDFRHDVESKIFSIIRDLKEKGRMSDYEKAVFITDRLFEDLA